MPERRLHLLTSDSPDHEVQLAASAEPMRAEPTRAEPTRSDAESSALQRMRLERDAALEDLAFLREQLRSTEAFYVHRLELVEAHLRAEHQSLLDELTRLGTEHQRRVRRDSGERAEERGAPSGPDAAPPFQWTR